MAFRNPGHARQVYTTTEYRNMVRGWLKTGQQVPLHVFQSNYANAFWDSKGKSISPETTTKSKEAFLNLMHWTGRIPPEVQTWEDYEEYSEASP